MFAQVDVEDLAAPVLRAVVQDAGISASEIDDVILGNAAGPGGNIARLSALRAGFGIDIAGVTTDRQCGSGLEAVMNACWLVAGGAGDVIVAGGVESVSRAPVRGMRSLDGGEPEFYGRARFSPEEIGDPEMGIAAENVARKYGISRQRQDEFSLQSQQRAAVARAAGVFASEIVEIADNRVDECIRTQASLEKMAQLRPVFQADGTVTAANACPLNDGSAAVVVMTAAKARALGHQRGLAFVDGAAAGVDPNLLGIGPVASTQKLLKRRADIDLKQLKLLEFNEAFAAQVLASLDELGLPDTLPSQQGGAIALGHPFGASGAILVTRLFSQMIRDPAADLPENALAMAMIGIGGGLGLTAAFEVLELG
jgi:acetyl-CoA C-acetyltransferase